MSGGFPHADEVRRIESAYAERDLTLAGTAKRDEANRGNHWLRRERRHRLEQILRERYEEGLSRMRVLDVGCGYGSLLAWFHELGVPASNLVGIDLLPKRIAAARRTYPEFTFLHGNAEACDLPDGYFDLVPAFTLFSSILDPTMANGVASTMMRVLKDEGAVVWYDMRYPNPWNKHLKAITKRGIRQLFPALVPELETISVLPPLARRLGNTADHTYPLLARIPFLRSHYLGLLRRVPDA
jgi:ubiquinone/menaquinone biosynthesis C-methylase UbiE